MSAKAMLKVSVTACSDVAALYKAVSSAYTIVLTFFTYNGKSFVKMEYNRALVSYLVELHS